MTRSTKSPKTSTAKSAWAGRPTKYDPKYCEDIIEFAREPGGTFEAFAASILVTKETLMEWARVHPEFSYAKKVAKHVNESAMMQIGVDGMRGKIAYGWQSAYIFTMKARHNWREDGHEDQEDVDLEFENTDDED